jgi:hypothetical protein
MKKRDTFVLAVLPGKALPDSELAFCDGSYYTSGDNPEFSNQAYRFSIFANTIILDGSGRRLDTFDARDSMKWQENALYNALYNDSYLPTVVSPLTQDSPSSWTKFDLEPTPMPIITGTGEPAIAFIPSFRISTSLKRLDIIRPWFNMDSFIERHSSLYPEAIITGLILAKDLRIDIYSSVRMTSSIAQSQTEVTPKESLREDANAIVGLICVVIS